MNFEKIEQAFSLLLENVQQIQNDYKTGFYEALIEQNAIYLNLGDEGADAEFLTENNSKIRALRLTPPEWHKTFQFVLMKGQQTEPLQPNHQATPESLGLLITFLIDVLVKKDSITVLELGSGMGNLAETIIGYTTKEIFYQGVELDDVLVELAASMSQIMETRDVIYIQGDAVRSTIVRNDIVVSDLPVGYYPDDYIAERFQVASPEGHTYAHHLLMEQGVKYLNPRGYAIYLAPTDLLTSPQSQYLKAWIKESTDLLGVVSLPDKLFANPKNAKSLFIFQKKSGKEVSPFVYSFSDLDDADQYRAFDELLESELK